MRGLQAVTVELTSTLLSRNIFIGLAHYYAAKYLEISKMANARTNIRPRYTGPRDMSALTRPSIACVSRLNVCFQEKTLNVVIGSFAAF